MTQMVSIRLDDELNQRLNKLAQQTGRTKTFYVREAVQEHLEALEDAYLADQVMKRIRDGKEKTYSLTDVMQNLHGELPGQS